MNNRVMIVGSCGFLFGNFLRKAAYEKLPYDFITIDKIKYPSALNSIYVNKNHSFHIADVQNKHILDAIFQYEEPDIVIHGADETQDDFVSSNVVGTQNVIDCCIKHSIKKLIYISSDKVYGHLSNENEPVWHEDSVLNPRNTYAATKASGELLIKAAHNASGLIYNIIRCSNIYGPRQDPEKLIPKAIKSILNNQPITIYGNGTQVRDWVHVYDVCSALMLIIAKGLPNAIYNLSTNQEFSTLEVLHLLCKAMGKGHELLSFVSSPSMNPDFRRASNSDKLKQLGWKPNFKFKDGIANTVEWYNNNKFFIK